MYDLYSHSPPFAVYRRAIGSMYKHKYVHAQKLLGNLLVKFGKGVGR